MRVIFYPHTMILSGTINAVELAAAVRDRGHEVIVLSKPGPLVETVRSLGLEHITLSPRARKIPSLSASVQLGRLAQQRRVDVVHSWEWPTAVEAFAGARLTRRIPVVCTIMSMSVAPFLPVTIPLAVGTEDLVRRTEQRGHSSVTLIEPPVDVRANAPDYDPGSFRAEFHLDTSPLLAVVCRLAHELKLEGLLAACDVVGKLAADSVEVQLAIVGDGPARPEVEAAAAEANSRAGRKVVTLTGALYDPRAAYASADIILGMGGSALRGMAFGKPLVVQGERGFWELLTPESAPVFLYQGWYGIGSEADGRAHGAMKLESIVRQLLAEPAKRRTLGDYGRDLVVKRFSLDRAAEVQEEIYATAIRTVAQESAAGLIGSAAQTAAGVFRHKATRKWGRMRGKAVAMDDFNAVVKNDPKGEK
jgi:glycosyltransferase involved in cell wall biosynthesis